MTMMPEQLSEAQTREILLALAGARGVTEWMTRVLAAQHLDLLGEGGMLETTAPQSSERKAVMDCDKHLRQTLHEPSDELVYALTMLANSRLRQL